jgi:hypothetical protein
MCRYLLIDLRRGTNTGGADVFTAAQDKSDGTKATAFEHTAAEIFGFTPK